MKNNHPPALYVISVKLIIILSVLLIVGCKKENPPDFIPTYEKGYILTCKINGEDWTHYTGRESSPASIHASFLQSYSRKGLLTIEGKNRAKNPFHNAVRLSLWGTKGSEKLRWSTNDPIYCYRNFNLTNFCDGFNYHLDKSFNNTFVLESFDTINKQVIGRFDYRAINPGCSDTVHISSGYFNVYYEEE